MLYILSFLLSWLCGMLSILIAAFFYYDQFNIIDITSFAALTFSGLLILFLLIYLPSLNLLKKKIDTRNQFLFFPLILVVFANLPAYFLIWKNMGDLYGQMDAFFFMLGSIVSGLTFGILMAWKNNRLNQPKNL